MIKSKAEMPYSESITIDLTGPQGNAFFLLGTASKLSLDLGWDNKKIRDEMMAGDYDNLVSVFDEYFGDFVVMYR